MAKNEIVDKLNGFISTHNPNFEECHVLYLMVEFRKLLDHESDHRNNGSFTLLRFYCDWSMHTDKEYITKSMKTVIDEIYLDIKKQILNPSLKRDKSPIIKFLYMDSLKSEMKIFLKKFKINNVIIEEGWINFVQNLVKILENQPIKNPNNNISLFSFLPAAEGCVYGTIKFIQPINGNNHYNFGNAY